MFQELVFGYRSMVQNDPPTRSSGGQRLESELLQRGHPLVGPSATGPVEDHREDARMVFNCHWKKLDRTWREKWEKY